MKTVAHRSTLAERYLSWKSFFYLLRRLHRRFDQWERSKPLAAWMRRWLSRRPREVAITNLDGNLRFKCALHTHIGSHIFWHDCYSFAQLRFFDKHLRCDMVYVDVGANVGEQTVFAAKRLTEGKVIAFEPTSSVHKLLTENVELNGFSNVTVLKCGLGDAPARLPIYTSADRASDGTFNDGVPTLYPTNSRGKLVELVDVVRFDDVVKEMGLGRLDVMKIDVEGAEMAVLRGAPEALRRFRPLLIVEVHEETSRAAGYSAATLIEYLESQGYRVEGLLPDGTTRPFPIEELPAFRDVVCYPIGGSEG